MYCGNCGAKNDDGNDFCIQCGANLKQFMAPGAPGAMNCLRLSLIHI